MGFKRKQTTAYRSPDLALDAKGIYYRVANPNSGSSFVLLGLRIAVGEEFADNSADLVYGKNLRIPGDQGLVKRNSLEEIGFLRLVREVVGKLKQPASSRSGEDLCHPEAAAYTTRGPR